MSVRFWLGAPSTLPTNGLRMGRSQAIKRMTDRDKGKAMLVTVIRQCSCSGPRFRDVLAHLRVLPDNFGMLSVLADLLIIVVACRRGKGVVTFFRMFRAVHRPYFLLFSFTSAFQ